MPQLRTEHFQATIEIPNLDLVVPFLVVFLVQRKENQLKSKDLGSLPNPQNPWHQVNGVGRGGGQAVSNFNQIPWN